MCKPGFLLRLHPFYVHRIEAKAELEAHAVKFNAKVAGNSGKVTIHIGDVSDDTSAQKALQGAAVAHGGIIDCIVTSAGISKPCRFEDMSATEFASVLTTNVTGTRNAIYHALPFMTRSTGGRIMLISSQAGQVGLYGYTAYSASKFALSGFAQSLSMEVYTRKIYVSVCFPPDTDTPLLAEENKTKPLVTKLLSAATETVSADVVAKSTVKSMEYFAPLVGIQFDGWMLATLTSGMTLQPNFFMALIELLTLGLWRMVGMIYMTYFFFVIGRNDIVKAGSTKGNPAGSKSNSVINNERKNN